MAWLPPSRLRAVKPDTDPNAQPAYNPLSVTYRVCFKFVPSRDDPTICECGRSRSHRDHEKTKDAQWTTEGNTMPICRAPTGKLINGALFARLALDTPESKAEHILFDSWRIRKPRLIISFRGGAKYFVLADRLESNFINGITDVARSSDAWLITDGYNVGVVQVVGQAIKKAALTDRRNKLVAIGVCKWGCVKKFEELIDRPNGRQLKHDRPERDQGNENDHISHEGERDLELNHTHYLMLDDGRLRDYSTKDYRTNLCLQIAKYHQFNVPPIPVVSIVVEGGRNTVEQMYYDLRANIPVVIIDANGRLADFFRRWLECTREMSDPKRANDEPYGIDNIDRVTEVETQWRREGPSSTSDSSKPKHMNFGGDLRHSRNTLLGIFQRYEMQLTADLDEVLSNDEDSKALINSDNNAREGIKESYQHVIFCLQPAVRSRISFFNLDTDTNLSEAIFRSICKARQILIEKKEKDQARVERRKQEKTNSQTDESTKKKLADSLARVNEHNRSADRTELLNLAMDWNCIDVAKELILQNSLDNILNQGDTFIYALKKDRPTFVYEFLKLGIQPAKVFFTSQKQQQRYKKFFADLYADDYRDVKTTHLSSFVQVADENAKKLIPNVDDLFIVLRSILGDHMQRLNFDSDADEVAYQTLNASSVAWNQPDDDVKDQSLIRKDDLIMRDLFIWAILHNYIDMAKVFLAHIKYRICAALIATKILKQYHARASHGELKDGYMASAQYFEQYAIDCVNQCEMHDGNMACEIVLQQIDLFGYVTCLQVAADAGDKLFIARPCCVQAIKNVWNDKIDPNRSQGLGRLSTAIGFSSLGLLGPVFVNYRKGITYKGMTPAPCLKSCGINYSDPYPLEYPHYFDTQPLISRYLHRLINFHDAPSMKYLYRCLFYFFFLLLFSYVLLFKFHPPTNQIPSIDWTEILTILLVSCMMIEELQYFCGLDNLTFVGKFSSYFQNLLKTMTMLSFVLFYVGLILRFTVKANEVDFTAARIVMAIALEIFWLRSLAFIIVIPFLGPHIVAIGKMLKDLLFFLCIIALVMAGYGVASRSMVFYPHKEDYVPYNASRGFDGRSIFRDIAYPVYYLMYGELSGELDNLDQTPDAGYSIATHVLLAIHVLFVNILLTNLLIAMFSKRFEQVYEDAQNIWHSQRYILTREYYSRAPLFPPFSVFYDIYRLIRMVVFRLWKTCGKSEDPEKKVFKMIALGREQVDEWGAFEGSSTYEYAHTHAKESRVNATASTAGSDARAIEKRGETGKAGMVSNDSAEDVKKLQEDLVRLNLSLDRINQQLKLLVGEKQDTSPNQFNPEPDSFYRQRRK